MENKSAENARTALIASVIMTVVLYSIPLGEMIARPLIYLSTLTHEMGHGIAAMLVGGEFDRFEMNPDASGVAYTKIPNSRIGSAIVSMGGLIGPAVVGGFLFAVGRKEKLSKVVLTLMGLFFLLSLVFVVRGMFGMVFVGLFGALTLWIGIKASHNLCQWYSYFIGVQLSLSVFSRGDYLFTKGAVVAGREMPSDVQQMADALLMPYWFWGLVCGAVSIGCLVFGLYVVFRK